MQVESSKNLVFESIHPDLGSSFKVINLNKVEQCNYYWHYHPEYEIVYTNSAYGKRQIGNHLTFYQEGDLVLIGPNLPHLNFGTLGHTAKEVVVQFSENFWGEPFNHLIEFTPIRQLLQQAIGGIAFYGETKKTVGLLMIKLADCAPLERLIVLLDILHHLAISDEVNLLNQTTGWTPQQLIQQQKLSIVLQYIETHYREKISLKELSTLLHMTESSFSRYFQKTTQMSCIYYLNSVRIRKICNELTQTDETISTIAFENGFESLPYFHRVFKKIAKQTPGSYRKRMQRSDLPIF